MRNTRENEVREHIPVPHDNLLQSILSSRHADKVIFSLGSMVAQAMANGHRVVSSLNKKLIIWRGKRKKDLFGLRQCQSRAGKLYVLLRNL